MSLRRDPKSGKMLSKFASLAQDNALAAAQFGQSKSEQTVTAIEFDAQHDSSAVRSYIDRLVELVREHSGSAADLQRILPLITETITIADVDASISKAEKARIKKLADALALQIRRKTALFARVGSALKNVARARTAAARDRTSEVLQASDSAIGKLAGKLLARRERDKSTVDKSLFGARSDLYQSAADNAEAAKEAKKKAKKPTPVTAPRGRQGRKVDADDSDDSGSQFSGGGTGDVGENTKVLNKIFDEVADIRDLLKAEANRRRLLDEQMERDADNKGGALSPTRAGRDKKGDGQIQKATSGIADWMARLGGWAALLAGFSKTVRGLFGTMMRGLRGTLAAIGGMFKRIATMARAAITGAFELIKTAATRVLGLMSGAAGYIALSAIPAVQLWISNKLAGVFNEMQEKYPFLNKGTQTAAGQAAAITNVKSNIQTTLENTRAGKVTEPVGGFESISEFNVRKQMGLKSKDYRALPESERQGREAAWRLKNPGLDPAHNKRKDIALGPEPARPKPASLPVGNAMALPEGMPLGAPPPMPSKSPKKGGPKTSTTSPTKADMSLSAAGWDALNKREGLPKGQKPGGPYTAYWDAIGGVWTIGHGLTGSVDGKKIGEGMVITAAEEEAEKRRRIKEVHEPDIRRGLGGKDIAQNLFDALVSVSYNTGPRKAGYNLARRVAQGESLTAEDFLKSATAKNKATGVSEPVKGLANRRLSEFQQATIAPIVAANRSAAPIAAAAAAGHGSTTIVAPQTIVQAPSRGSSGTTYVPMPIVTENTDDTLRALRNIGG